MSERFHSRPSARAGIVGVLLVSLLANGCFTYAPVADPGALRPAREVQLRLARPADFRLTNLTANDVATISGEVIRAGADSVVVSARWLRARSGYEFVGSGETVAVARSEIAAVETKRVSVLRSALMAGAVAAAIATAGAVVAGGGGGEGWGGGGEEVQ